MSMKRSGFDRQSEHPLGGLRRLSLNPCKISVDGRSDPQYARSAGSGERPAAANFERQLLEPAESRAQRIGESREPGGFSVL